MINIIQNFYRGNNPYDIARLNGVDDPEDMFAWAFGLGYGCQAISKTHLIWNDLHKDLFVLHGSDDFKASIIKICEAWKKVKDERLLNRHSSTQ